MLTKEQIQAAFPPQLTASVSDRLVDTMNNLSMDPEAAEYVRENFLSYGRVLQEGKFTVEEYTNAVTYVSFKLMGHTNEDAYKRTFPSRYTVLVARGASKKDISSYVAAFNKGKLVNLILEQTLVPMWILNQDVYQKAINTQLELMVSARSEKVRSDAANSILTHLKRPEKHQVELSMTVPESSGMKELKGMLDQLAEQQRVMINGGTTTRDIAHQKLIEATAIDVSPTEED